jgi:hypothetical protein
MPRRRCRPIATLLLIWYLPACASFQATGVPPEEAVANTDRAILTVRDGDTTVTVHVMNPWVHNDSIGGVPCTKDWQCDRTARWAASLAYVPVLKTRRPNPLGIVLPVAIAVTAIMTLVATIELTDALEKSLEK